MRHTSFIMWSLLLCLATAAQAQRFQIETGDIIGPASPPSAPTRQSLPWDVTDQAGFRWDIQGNGSVGDGSNDAYDGGVQLSLAGGGFGSQGEARLIGENEIELGPWRRNSEWQVTRQVYVDKDDSYARWIDTFHNTSNSTQSIEVAYFWNLGFSIEQARAGSGNELPTDGDWAFVTAPAAGAEQPGVVHIVGAPGADLKPRFQISKGQDTAYVFFKLQVPAGQKVSLFVIEMQRKDFDTAAAAMESFKLASALRKIPRELRDNVLNLAMPKLEIGGLELPRDETNDIILLKDDTEVIGRIQNESFTLQTAEGNVELQAGSVLGFQTVGVDAQLIRLALTDGQILGGRLTSGPLEMTLADGNVVSLSVRDIARVGYHVSEAKPTNINIRRPTLLLRGREQIFFDPANFDGRFLTEYGEVTLQPVDLKTLTLAADEGGLHRATFRDGSVLSGLWQAQAVTVQPAIGPQRTVRRAVIQQVAFPAGAHTNPRAAVATLRNQDVLRGKVLNDTLSLKRGRETLTLNPADIKQLTRAENALRTVTIALHSGATVSGDLLEDTLTFDLDTGPTLEVFIGHVNTLTCPAPPAPETPADAPATQPDDTNANESSGSSEIEKLRAELAERERDLVNHRKLMSDVAARVKAGQSQPGDREVLKKSQGALMTSMRAIEELRRRLS